MGIYFGTDGIRGIAIEELSTEIAEKLGATLASMKENSNIIIAKDTRKSCDLLLHSFVKGAISQGANVVSIKIAPTPCVSYLVKLLKFDYGVVISASHNPEQYNGIKIFGSNGQKILDSFEVRLEKQLFIPKLINPKKLGMFEEKTELLKYYLLNVYSILNKKLDLKIVVDCSNGAGSKIIPKTLKKLGAKVYTIGNKPNGYNINLNCGALSLNTLKKKVLKTHADIGFAFDGDADRLIAVDENGEEFDGDQIVCLLAKFLKVQGELENDSVVLTVQTNTGIEEDLLSHGIQMIRSDVGDKYVIEKMNNFGLSLGGEQSGHIIIKKYAESGDGLITAIMVAKILSENNLKLSDLRVTNLCFQVTENIMVEDKNMIMNNKEICSYKNYLESILDSGRIVLRASGTEPKIRIMVEHKCKEVAESTLLLLSSRIKELIYK